MKTPKEWAEEALRRRPLMQPRDADRLHDDVRRAIVGALEEQREYYRDVLAAGEDAARHIAFWEPKRD